MSIQHSAQFFSIAGGASKWKAFSIVARRGSQTEHHHVWLWLGIANDVDEELTEILRISCQQIGGSRDGRLQRCRRWNAAGSAAHSNGFIRARIARGKAWLLRCEDRRWSSVDMESFEGNWLRNAGMSLTFHFHVNIIKFSIIRLQWLIQLPTALSVSTS